MECIDELKKIGIDKVSAKTRITQDKLQNIIDFKYDAFDKTRARGFVQIIKREYGIDLEEWFAAYNDYHSANTEQTEESNESVDEIAKQINIPIESDKKDKSYIVLIVLLIVLVVLFMSFFIYNNFISPSNTSANSANQSTLTPLQQIQQNKNDLAREEAVQSEINANQNDDTESANLNANQSNPSENQSTDSSKGDLAQNANESANLPTNATNPSTETPNANQTPQTIATQIEELIITPNEPLWVGIIDLKSRRKKQLSIDARHTISLDGDKLIRTGHSYFGISSGTNFAKQYIGGDNKYFLYKVDGGLSEISKAEFLELNKGEEW